MHTVFTCVVTNAAVFVVVLVRLLLFCLGCLDTEMPSDVQLCLEVWGTV